MTKEKIEEKFGDWIRIAVIVYATYLPSAIAGWSVAYFDLAWYIRVGIVAVGFVTAGLCMCGTCAVMIRQTDKELAEELKERGFELHVPKTEEELCQPN